MKFKFVLFFLCTTNLILGCNYSTPKESAETQNTNIVLSVTDLSYIKLNEQIFKPKCLSCHSGKEEPNLTTYKSIVDNKFDIYEDTINSSSMPKNNRKLTDIEKQNLKTWLDAGAPEFSQTPDTPVTPPTNLPINSFIRPVLWETVKTQIFDKSCTSCHFAGNTDGLSSYEDYEQTKATVGTIFYTVSINPVMPPGPADLAEGAENPNQLTREEKDLLSAWITDGMKK